MFKPNKLQMIDDRCNLIFPWYVHSFLTEWLKFQDLKDADIFEWGGGASSVWYAYNSKHVDVLETDKSWTDLIDKSMKENNLENFSLKVIDVEHLSAPYGSQTRPTKNMHEYLQYITTMNKMYDFIIIDGSYRDAAIPISIECLKSGGYLIFDNYHQITSGYLSLSNQKYLDAMNQVYIGQSGDWKTAAWRK